MEETLAVVSHAGLKCASVPSECGEAVFDMVTIRITEQDGSTIAAEIVVDGHRLTVITSVSFKEDTVILYKLHVDGPGANVLGTAKLREIAAAVMEQYDVAELEIHGFPRTTGASPGRTPGVLRFRRR